MSIEAMKRVLEALDNNAWAAPRGSELEAAYIALRQAIEQAEKQEPDLPPVEIGVDVTEHGTTVVAFYRRPNAVMEMFYSQFHPQPKQPKNPSIRIQNHAHTEQTGRCTSCGGALPVTGRLDRTGECDCEVVSSIFWFSAPTKTEWGQDMVCANIQIDKDHTLTMYCEQSQIHKVPNVIEVKSIRGRTE